jgi:hypothetical protein
MPDAVSTAQTSIKTENYEVFHIFPPWKIVFQQFSLKKTFGKVPTSGITKFTWNLCCVHDFS